MFLLGHACLNEVEILIHVLRDVTARLLDICTGQLIGLGAIGCGIGKRQGGDMGMKRACETFRDIVLKNRGFRMYTKVDEYIAFMATLAVSLYALECKRTEMYRILSRRCIDYCVSRGGCW